MAGVFSFLQQNPYLLLFLVVGLAVWIGRITIKGYGLGMVAGAIVVGAAVSVWASIYGVQLGVERFCQKPVLSFHVWGRPARRTFLRQ